MGRCADEGAGDSRSRAFFVFLYIVLATIANDSEPRFLTIGATPSLLAASPIGHGYGTVLVPVDEVP